MKLVEPKRRYLLSLLLAWGAMAGLLVVATSILSAAPTAGRTYKIFDGKSLAGWKITDFGGQGEVAVEKGEVILPVGQDMTGITWDAKSPPQKLTMPTEDYELQLDAMRVDGADFFCGITFPVSDKPCSLILGGWGGGVVGLSSINGMDASENETTQYMEFDNKKWYHVRLRVTRERISAWIDDKEIIDIARKDKEFGIRYEVELSRPLGFATWQTKGALRNISLTLLDEEEKSPSDIPAGAQEDAAQPAPVAVNQEDAPQSAPAACAASSGATKCCRPSRKLFHRAGRRCR